MPPIRQLFVNNGEVRWIDCNGNEHVFTPSALPPNLSIAQAEAWINSWLKSRINGYKMIVHIFSLSPLQLTVATCDESETLSPNWWMTNG